MVLWVNQNNIIGKTNIAVEEKVYDVDIIVGGTHV